jgi:SAM-dependent MidA family methyltransferase
MPDPLPLAGLLAARIRERGPLTFADFMEQCLYHSQHGYYAQAEARRFADYYTSVDVHPIFGRLLARQLEEMWRALGSPAEFHAVECGAGVGRLAGHILEFAARELPQFYHALRYTAVEFSAARRAQHSDRLAAHLLTGRAQSSAEWPGQIPAGCVFSNELLDALPVHRVVQRNRAPQEIFVDWRDGRFTECVGPPSTPRLVAYFSAQGITLPEGAQTEAGLAACDWITDAARRLTRGFVLTVDYGHEARELYNERHLRGTLLAYHQHRASEDYYARPGEQDLTAHVNFTALDLWGQRAGLRSLGLVSQTRFLLALGRSNDFADLYDEAMDEIGRTRARLQLKTLICPEGMGETFSVLVQQKGGEAITLRGLQPL